MKGFTHHQSHLMTLHGAAQCPWNLMGCCGQSRCYVYMRFLSKECLRSWARGCASMFLELHHAVFSLH